MSKRTLQSSRKKKKNKLPIIAKVGEEIRFLYPGWVAPKYILKGVVTQIDDGCCTDGGPLYTVKFSRQEAFLIEAGVMDDIFPDNVKAGETKMGNVSIEKAKRIK